MTLRGSMGQDRWPSVQAAIQAGKSSNVESKIRKCLDNTLQWIPIFNAYRGDIPLAFMVAKAAFESCGRADAGKSKMTDIGLFQLFPKHLERNGFAPVAGLKPDVNTRVFVKILQGRAASFLESHGSWFPNGKDWSFWGIMWLTAAIGPGATRHLLAQVSQGAGAFNKVISFVNSHPGWMEQLEQDQKWGNQSGRLVAFRVMITWDVMRIIRQLDGSDVLQAPPGAPSAGRGGGLGRKVGIGMAILSSAATASLTGYVVYKAIRRTR